MNYIVINKLITKSIYKQIADSISIAIESGVLTYNDKLPTEKEICNMFGISQTAVKMAYESLIQEGLIKRIKGKGTYVTNRKTVYTDLHSFYQLEQALSTTKKVLLLDRSNKDLNAVRTLGLEPKEKYYQITTLFLDKKNPLLLQRAFVPISFLPNIQDTIDEFTNIYDFLENTYSFTIEYMQSTFSPFNVSASDALLLNIKKDDAVYLVKTKLLDNKEHVIGYINNYYPGDFTEFEVVVHAKD